MTKPSTPLFKRLSSIVRRMDALGDSNTNAVSDALTHLALDIETMVYMAQQRVLRLPGTKTTRLINALGGTWLDGFMAGYLLASGDVGFLPSDPGPIPE